MASNVRAHRALTAGLSAGACLAIPAAAFAATIPFEDVHATVGAAAMPFAIGSLAGMGVLAATPVWFLPMRSSSTKPLSMLRPLRASVRRMRALRVVRACP